MKRRNLLIGALGGIVSAPAIVHASNIMRVNPTLWAPDCGPEENGGVWIAPTSDVTGRSGAWVRADDSSLFQWCAGDQSHHLRNPSDFWSRQRHQWRAA